MFLLCCFLQQHCLVVIMRAALAGIVQAAGVGEICSSTSEKSVHVHVCNRSSNTTYTLTHNRQAATDCLTTISWVSRFTAASRSGGDGVIASFAWEALADPEAAAGWVACVVPVFVWLV